MTAANSGTTEVREKHRFDESALERFMAENVADFAGPLTVRQFKGGQSNPTYRIETPNAVYAMRRKPPGQLLKSAHAVDREYRVITALGQTGVPVPRTYALCEDDSVIGTWFYVMECVEGRIFWDGTIPDVDKAERAAIYNAMNETLAKLHMVDYQAVGLGDYGKPGNYFERQIGRWSKQYKASETENSPAMNNLMEWLPANVPAKDKGGDETSIVHGDYRLDNMIIHATEPRVVAILDWELSTLGHPLGDLSYQCSQWRLPRAAYGLAEIDRASLGIPTEEEYVAAYCRRTGREAIENWEFYIAYNLFRLAAILQGIMGRVRDGTAASAEAKARGAMALPIAEAGWRVVEEMAG